jgi:hypothetical protein
LLRTSVKASHRTFSFSTFFGIAVLLLLAQLVLQVLQLLQRRPAAWT